MSDTSEASEINSTKPVKVAITGGGTGGHIYPALAVAQYLQEAHQAQISYIGDDRHLEGTLVPEKNIAFESLHFYGMPRKKTWCLPCEMLHSYGSLRRAIKEAKTILSGIQPDVVFGTGGYISAPVLMAAKSLRIPYVIHEPDAHPGLANRHVAASAEAVTAAFAEAKTMFDLPDESRFTVTGNPITTEFEALTSESARQQLAQHLGVTFEAHDRILLVFGGSQGARSINEAVLNALPTLISQLQLHVVHVSGKARFEEVNEQLETLKYSSDILSHYHLIPYSTTMPVMLTASDVVVCRAGSMSLSEVYRAGTPSVLVPYPYAAANHQQKNAEASVACGASMMILDATLSDDTLIKTLVSLFSDPKHQKKMAEEAMRLARPTATKDIASKVLASVKTQTNEADMAGKKYSGLD